MRNAANLGRRSAQADRIARVLTSINAFLTLIALGHGIYRLTQAPPDELIVQGWRTFGFLVFLAFWVMVTIWPRRTPGAWELMFVHKVAITTFALALAGVPEARETAMVDGWLVVSGAVAYVLTRGWTAWRPLIDKRATGADLAPAHA
ncbi:hypothetical protein [Actinoplanes sp. DH11]|uniref:hypothetical protein n=1 Tax=Actinoplanes sp. DH11 TaxID=2857011 RepID=UPI001E6378EF|nr:hypothetical protein [Actinoplanes sp. DH11]